MKTTIFKPFDIVEVPFPFTEKKAEKKRKALVLSAPEFHKRNRALVLMMITSAEHSHWEGDTDIHEWKKAGLKKPCKTRLKLFTLDAGLILRKSGKFTAGDQKAVKKNFIRWVLPAGK